MGAQWFQFQCAQANGRPSLEAASFTVVVHLRSPVAGSATATLAKALCQRQKASRRPFGPAVATREQAYFFSIVNANSSH
jgi:hypothetical protein